MAEIASALDVAEGTIYLYFPTKQALVIGVVLAWYGDIVDETERTLGQFSTPLDRLEYLIRQHIEMILAQPSMYLLFIREVRASPVYESSGGRALNRRYTDLLRTAIEGLTPNSTLAFPFQRDLVYGGVEHVAWSAIQHPTGVALDVSAMARLLALTYAKAFGADSFSHQDVGCSITERFDRIDRAIDALSVRLGSL